MCSISSMQTAPRSKSSSIIVHRSGLVVNSSVATSPWLRRRYCGSPMLVTNSVKSCCDAVDDHRQTTPSKRDFIHGYCLGHLGAESWKLEKRDISITDTRVMTFLILIYIVMWDDVSLARRCTAVSGSCVYILTYMTPFNIFNVLYILYV